jgi:hypothetical protein
MMNGYEYQSDFAKKHVADGREQGRVEGAARALLTALRVRVIAVADATRRRILTQTDLEQLDRWMEKVVLATSLAEVLGETSGGVPLPNEAAQQAQEARRAGHNYQWEFAKRYFDEGREGGLADGVAHALLIALRARGISAHERARVRILAQKDLEQLDRWLEKAVVATSLVEVVGEETANEAGRQALESLIKDYDQKRDFAKKYLEQGFETARKHASEEGRAQGYKEGVRALLMRMLRARFGELSASVVGRVESAEAAVVERWSDRVLSVTSVAEVLDEPS